MKENVKAILGLLLSLFSGRRVHRDVVVVRRKVDVVVERHGDGYVALPIGMEGVVGQGDTAEAAIADVKSAIHFHLEMFGDQGDAGRRV